MSRRRARPIHLSVDPFGRPWTHGYMKFSALCLAPPDGAPLRTTTRPDAVTCQACIAARVNTALDKRLDLDHVMKHFLSPPKF